ncbi:PD-(D/E)XK nuclease family protein [Leptolyngbya sp. FACHB-261]|uniref:PD-(D/E)XK nuclease family protein n=1 Tax=Leptolyngbya sp. FACHB-261 TaxID=2692806 RepID=UPI0016894167|nr:PD-(D/E)XK nuclease family protein [Leptolyngbya sp. FACHB-261]MBD2105317.1 PD-(D/E)XK nuclease family protein [Leptolyngbya sp. FACHB-261]
MTSIDSLASRRVTPYIWVTWLSKLMVDENQCEWASWFRAHYKYEKTPSGFDAVKWNSAHNELVNRRVKELEAEGFTVYVEDDNRFEILGRDGITKVAGKADIVAIKGDQAIVEDCKTGKPRSSDHMQVLIYMLLLPLGARHCQGLKLEGRIVYLDSVENILASSVDSFRGTFRRTVETVSNSRPARKVPSLRECRFCDVSKKYCSERVNEDLPEVSQEHDLF